MPDIKRNTNREFINFFRSRLSSLSVETASKYSRTISDLDCFLSGHRLQFSDLSPALVADWASELFRQGLAVNTVVRHLNILSGLIKSAVKKNMMEPDDSPRKLAAHLSGSPTTLPPLVREAAFNKCLSALRDILKKQSGFNIFEDILLFSLANGALPLIEAVMIKKGDISKYPNEVSRLIIERNQSPRREYVFDLRQSYDTPRQIISSISKGLKTLWDKTGLPSGADPDNAVRSIWAACAIRGGATASETLGCIGNTAPYTIPDFCTAAQDMPDTRLWDNAVHSMIAHELPVWYAMHLRKGVCFDDLRKEISENVRPVPELFYPSETVRRRIGNKTVIEEHPFISRTAFFKSRQENILPMFSLIGDKAWCYRVSNTPGAPYAAISSRDMQRFQAAIGVFTPDIEIHPLGELTPQPGESVIIIKAGYNNREGEVEEVIDNGCGTTIFRIKLSTDQGYEWRVDLDARQLLPVNR